MADNTTTYKAVIDAEVKGADEIKDLGDKTEETGDKFVKLQLQIRQTQKDLQAAAAAGDKVKFDKLRAQLDDLEDGLEKVQFQSKQFEDQLASLPGPAGQAGGAVKGVSDAFKLLLANPVIAVIGAIIGIFLLFKKSLESTAEGQETLNRISTAFGKILGPILATIEKVALPLFEGLAFVLEKVGEGFAFVARKIGIADSKIKEASSGIKDFKKANEDAAKAAKDASDKAEADAKKKAEDAKKRAEESKRQAEEARKKAEELKQKRIEEAKSAIELASKAQSAEQNLANARKKRFDDRIEEIKNEQVEADVAYKIEVDRINNLLKVQGLAEKERKQLLIDRTNAEAKYLEDKKKMEGAIIEEEKKRAEEKKKEEEKAAEDKKKKDEEDAKKKEEDAQKLADAESQARMDKAARIYSEYELQDTLTKQSFQSQIDTFDKVRELERADMVAKMASADALAAFDAETAKTRVDIERAATEAKLGIVSNALGTIAQAVGEQTVAGKALAVAQATIDTYLGATKALATYPPPFGAIAAGTVILAGLLNVRKIISTQVPKMPGATGGGGGNVSTPSIQAPSVSSPQVPQLQGGGAINPTTQIAEGLSRASNKPIKAYVVGTDMSSQQALDRRTTSAATF
jgi:DNA repair exonuclease SbcCD ATPase subunit